MLSTGEGDNTHPASRGSDKIPFLNTKLHCSKQDCWKKGLSGLCEKLKQTDKHSTSTIILKLLITVTPTGKNPALILNHSQGQVSKNYLKNRLKDELSWVMTWDCTVSNNGTKQQTTKVLFIQASSLRVLYFTDSKAGIWMRGLEAGPYSE